MLTNFDDVITLFILNRSDAVAAILGSVARWRLSILLQCLAKIVARPFCWHAQPNPAPHETVGIAPFSCVTWSSEKIFTFEAGIGVWDGAVGTGRGRWGRPAGGGEAALDDMKHQA